MALVLDGKTFAEATMVVALGITMTGDKRFLGSRSRHHRERGSTSVRCQREYGVPVPPVLGRAGPRCFPGASGDRRWRQGAPGGRAEGLPPPYNALVQRCQWHKRENVVYLAKREQPVWRQRLQRAYNRPEYDEALAALQSLQHELEDRNQSAMPAVWRKALDETLTSPRRVWRAGPVAYGLESINALIEERCAKVDHLLKSTPALAPRRSWTSSRWATGTCPGFVTH